MGEAVLNFLEQGKKYLKAKILKSLLAPPLCLSATLACVNAE